MIGFTSFNTPEDLKELRAMGADRSPAEVAAAKADIEEKLKRIEKPADDPRRYGKSTLELAAEALEDLRRHADALHPDALARGINEAAALETERLCGEAQARGAGWRLWRSNPVVEDFVMTHTYKLLAPGEPPPGAGIVFGPWPPCASTCADGEDKPGCPECRR